MSGAVVLWPGLLALISAGFAVTRASVVHGLIWLVACLLSLAACFYGLGASFAGAVQVLIYAGAIMAVFVFVVMTVDSAPEVLAVERARLNLAWPLPFVVMLAAQAPLVLGFAGGLGQAHAVGARRLGALLFGPWAVAVEAAGFLLLAALLGARHLGRRGAEEVGK
jgi:NADH-quinone oxidoreductase subunit J